MSYVAVAKYMKKSKIFVSKWVKRYSEVKNIDDLPNRNLDTNNDEKGEQNDFTGIREEFSSIIMWWVSSFV